MNFNKLVNSIICEGRRFDLNREYTGEEIHEYSPGSRYFYFMSYSPDTIYNIIEIFKENNNFGLNTWIFEGKSKRLYEVQTLVRLETTQTVEFLKNLKNNINFLIKEKNKTAEGFTTYGTYMDPSVKEDTFKLVYKGSKYNMDPETANDWSEIVNEL